MLDKQFERIGEKHQEAKAKKSTLVLKPFYPFIPITPNNLIKHTDKYKNSPLFDIWGGYILNNRPTPS